MLVVKTAEPYAEALLSFAVSNDALTETQRDINTIFQLLQNSKDLKGFLANPFIPSDAKKNVLKDLLGESINDSSLTFLMLLVDRRRINILESVIQKFRELCYKRDSLEIAKLTSAVPFSTEQLKELADKLKALTGAKKIKYALRVDPYLMGGFKVEIDSKLLDASIRGQLTKLSRILGK